MSEQSAARLLDCAQRGDLTGYAEALTGLPVSQLNTIGKLPTFRQSVAALVPVARDGTTARIRLAALALIGRADNTTQQKQLEIAEYATAAIALPPPPLDAQAQEDLKPEDRFYIGLVATRGDPAWSLPYAALALVNEGGEPKKQKDVRATFAGMIFDRAPTLAAAFALIAAAVPGSLHHDPATKDHELSRARRLTKLLPAIEDAMRSTLRDSGDGLASAFNAMLHGLMFRYGRPIAGAEADDVAGEAADAAFKLLSTLVRTRFSAAVEVEAYRTVGRAQAWLKTRSWPDATDASRQRLNQSLIEAVAVRASMGKASQELVAVLVQLAGHRGTIERQLAPLAGRPDVPADVQDWLRAGGKPVPPRFETEDSDEAGRRDIDTMLASATIRALQVKSSIETDMLGAIGLVRQHEDLAAVGRTLTQGLNYARALANDVVAIARRRSMSVFGSPGEVVSAEPKRHIGSDGRGIITEKIRIDRLGVERTLPNGTTEVIVQATGTGVGTKRK